MNTSQMSLLGQYVDKNFQLYVDRPEARLSYANAIRGNGEGGRTPLELLGNAHSGYQRLLFSFA